MHRAGEKELTKYQRDGWELAASGLGSAYDQGKKDVSRGSKNIVPSRNVLMSGYNCYIRSNYDAYYARFNIPRDEAPTGDSLPVFPEEVNALYDNQNGVVTIEFSRPAILDDVTDASVEIWCKVQSYHSGESHLLGIVPIQSSQEELKEEKMYRASFTHFFGRKDKFGKYEVAFKELDGGFVRLQLATVVAYGPQRGAIRSSGSAVCEIVLPPNPDSPITPVIKKFWSEYRKWQKDTFSARIKGEAHPLQPKIEDFMNPVTSY